MRVVIAPDSFSGTLTAPEAADCMAEGWRRARPSDDVVVVPMADGGEGTLAAIIRSRPEAVEHAVEVADARGVATTASWLTLTDGVAVVETAQANGLHRLAAEHRDPLRTTSYGVGQLLRAAIDGVDGVPTEQLIIGLGGSATVDGGAGMASSLTGHGLRRADGNGVKVGGRWVGQTASVRPFAAPAGLAVTIASDVTAPLLGPRGAAAVFGPQKGADPAAVAELEACLERFADVVERQVPGGPWRDRPGAGAAGGIGFALMALLGGHMASGAAVVAGLVALSCAGADIVLTGEGRLDPQTSTGKAPAVVARMAHEAGARTWAIAGEVAGPTPSLFDRAVALGPGGLTDPRGSVTAAAEGLARSLPE